VESATFADFIKNSGWQSLTTWHYVDTPFFDEGFTTVVNDDPSNVVWAID
jgi:S1/P1 Nuclease